MLNLGPKLFKNKNPFSIQRSRRRLPLEKSQIWKEVEEGGDQGDSGRDLGGGEGVGRGRCAGLLAPPCWKEENGGEEEDGENPGGVAGGARRAIRSRDLPPASHAKISCSAAAATAVSHEVTRGLKGRRALHR